MVWWGGRSYDEPLGAWWAHRGSGLGVLSCAVLCCDALCCAVHGGNLGVSGLACAGHGAGGSGTCVYVSSIAGSARFCPYGPGSSGHQC